MKNVFLILLIASACFIAACSSNTPINLNDSTPDATFSSGDTAIAGSGQILLDPSGTAQIIPDRNAEWHYEVTSLLASGCPGGCFTFTILDISGEVWTIELSIENPTAIQVHDVRILYTNTYGKTILNQDGYIDMFGYQFCPFTAFAKEYPNHAFPVGPGVTDTEILELGWPLGASPSVYYIIEVSLGGNCDEPWMIEGSISNDIPSEGGSAIVSASVYDWQDDANHCWCDWSILGGSNEEMALVGEDVGRRDFELEIVTTLGIPEGEYALIIESSDALPVYDIVIATVYAPSEPINLTNDDIDNRLNFTSKTVSAYDDEVFVVWSEDTTGDTFTEIYFSEKVGGAWSEKFLLFPNIDDDDFYNMPSIAVNEVTGDLHTITQGYNNGTSGIAYRKRIGKSWRDIQVLIDDPFAYDAQLDVENDGKVHVAFHGANGPFFCIKHLLDPGTGTFNPAEILMIGASPMDIFYNPAMDHDSEGCFHMTATTGFGGDNGIAYKFWNGYNWSSTGMVLNDNESMWQDISVAPDRKATMVYVKDDSNLWMKQWAGFWEIGENQVTTDAQMYGIPNIDSDSLGNMHLAYSGETDGDRDIYYTVMDEDTEVWSTPVNLSDNTSASENPGLFVGPDDTVHIVWQDNADGDIDVYYIAL